MALEYTGRSFDELRADNFRDRVFHPEDVQRLREEQPIPLSGTAPFENEQRAAWTIDPDPGFLLSSEGFIADYTAVKGLAALYFFSQSFPLHLSVCMISSWILALQ